MGLKKRVLTFLSPKSSDSFSSSPSSDEKSSSICAEHKEFPSDQSKSFPFSFQFPFLRKQSVKTHHTGANIKHYDVDEHMLSPEEVALKYGLEGCDFSSIPPRSQGLSAAEAEERLGTYGRNELQPPHIIPEWMKLLLQFTNPLMMLLLVASGLCFLAYGVQKPRQRNNLILAAALAVVVTATCVMTYLQERAASNVMASLKSLMPSRVVVIRDGHEIRLDAFHLVPGDFVRLTIGDRVPADLRIVYAQELKVETSSLTGESDLVPLSVDRHNDLPAEARNIAFMSSLVMNGGGVGIVVRTGDRTFIGSIAQLAGGTENQESSLQKEVKHLVHFIAIISIVTAAIFFAIGMGRRKLDVMDVFVNGLILVIVANIPEGLPATVTSCLALTAQRLKDRQVLIKRTDIIESLGSVSIIASDKTGTLTQNRMTVEHCWIYGNEVQNAAGFRSVGAPSHWGGGVGIGGVGGAVMGSGDGSRRGRDGVTPVISSTSRSRGKGMRPIPPLSPVAFPDIPSPGALTTLSQKDWSKDIDGVAGVDQEGKERGLVRGGGGGGGGGGSLGRDGGGGLGRLSRFTLEGPVASSLAAGSMPNLNRASKRIAELSMIAHQHHLRLFQYQQVENMRRLYQLHKDSLARRRGEGGWGGDRGAGEGWGVEGQPRGAGHQQGWEFQQGRGRQGDGQGDEALLVGGVAEGNEEKERSRENEREESRDRLNNSNVVAFPNETGSSHQAAPSSQFVDIDMNLPPLVTMSTTSGSMAAPHHFHPPTVRPNRLHSSAGPDLQDEGRKVGGVGVEREEIKSERGEIKSDKERIKSEKGSQSKRKGLMTKGESMSKSASEDNDKNLLMSSKTKALRESKEGNISSRFPNNDACPTPFTNTSIGSSANPSTIEPSSGSIRAVSSTSHAAPNAPTAAATPASAAAPNLPPQLEWNEVIGHRGDRAGRTGIGQGGWSSREGGITEGVDEEDEDEDEDEERKERRDADKDGKNEGKRSIQRVEGEGDEASKLNQFMKNALGRKVGHKEARSDEEEDEQEEDDELDDTVSDPGADAAMLLPPLPTISSNGNHKRRGSQDRDEVDAYNLVPPPLLNTAPGTTPHSPIQSSTSFPPLPPLAPPPPLFTASSSFPASTLISPTAAASTTPSAAATSSSPTATRQMTHHPYLQTLIAALPLPSSSLDHASAMSLGRSSRPRGDGCLEIFPAASPTSRVTLESSYFTPSPYLAASSYVTPPYSSVNREASPDIPLPSDAIKDYAMTKSEYPGSGPSVSYTYDTSTAPSYTLPSPPPSLPPLHPPPPPPPPHLHPPVTSAHGQWQMEVGASPWALQEVALGLIPWAYLTALSRLTIAACVCNKARYEGRGEGGEGGEGAEGGEGGEGGGTGQVTETKDDKNNVLHKVQSELSAKAKERGEKVEQGMARRDPRAKFREDSQRDAKVPSSQKKSISESWGIAKKWLRNRLFRKSEQPPIVLHQVALEDEKSKAVLGSGRLENWPSGVVEESLATSASPNASTVPILSPNSTTPISSTPISTFTNIPPPPPPPLLLPPSSPIMHAPHDPANTPPPGRARPAPIMPVVSPSVAKKMLGDATDIGLLKWCEGIGLRIGGVRSLRAAMPVVFEIPFNSTNKWSMVIVKPPGTPAAAKAAALHSGQEEYGNILNSLFPGNTVEGAGSEKNGNLAQGENLTGVAYEESDVQLVILKGAPEVVLKRCSYTWHVKRGVQPIDDHLTDSMMTAYERCGVMGERVIAFACKEVPVRTTNEWQTITSAQTSSQQSQTEKTIDLATDPTTNLILLGLISLVDPPRQGVAEAVARCRGAGIRVSMVTGDHPLTAEAIARKVGIVTLATSREVAASIGLPESSISYSDPRVGAVVVAGSKLRDIRDDVDLWDEILDHEEVVFARTSPQQKLEIVKHLQRRGEVVVVTGDGVNDSPALKAAQVGVAMGLGGSDVAREAADIVLLDDQFPSIVNGIEEGRLIFSNLKKTIAYTLTHALPELLPIFLSLALSIPMGLGGLLILSIDLVTEQGPAISLAYEPSESEIMKEPPRDVLFDRLISGAVLRYSYLVAGVLESGLCVVAFFSVFLYHGVNPSHLLWGTDNGYFTNDDSKPLVLQGGSKVLTPAEQQDIYWEAQSAWYVTLVLCQFWHIWMCKTRRAPLLTHGIFRNPITLMGCFVSLTVIMVIVFVPALHSVFLTHALGWYGWLPQFGFPLVIYPLLELSKSITRKNPQGWWARNIQW